MPESRQPLDKAAGWKGALHRKHFCFWRAPDSNAESGFLFSGEMKNGAAG